MSGPASSTALSFRGHSWRRRHGQPSPSPQGPVLLLLPTGWLRLLPAPPHQVHHTCLGPCPCPCLGSCFNHVRARTCYLRHRGFCYRFQTSRGFSVNTFPAPPSGRGGRALLVEPGTLVLPFLGGHEFPLGPSGCRLPLWLSRPVDRATCRRILGASSAGPLAAPIYRPLKGCPALAGREPASRDAGPQAASSKRLPPARQDVVFLVLLQSWCLHLPSQPRARRALIDWALMAGGGRLGGAEPRGRCGPLSPDAQTQGGWTAAWPLPCGVFNPLHCCPGSLRGGQGHRGGGGGTIPADIRTAFNPKGQLPG